MNLPVQPRDVLVDAHQLVFILRRQYDQHRENAGQREANRNRRGHHGPVAAEGLTGEIDGDLHLIISGYGPQIAQQPRVIFAGSA